MSRISHKAKVCKANDLVNSKYKLTVTQSRIIFSIISLINEKDTEFKTYRIPVSEFDWLVDPSKKKKNNTYLRTQFREILKKTLDIPTENGWLLANWFADVEYNSKEGYVEVSFSQKLKPYLLELTRNYTPMYLTQVMKLTSEYSIRIYELCKKWHRAGGFTLSLDELHEMFQIPKSYKIYNNFKQKVLDVAVKEINGKNEYDMTGGTDIFISFTEIKIGRKVTDIKFTIESKKKAVTKKSDSNGLDLYKEQSIVSVHDSLDEWMVGHFDKNIQIDGVTYLLKECRIVDGKFVIFTDRKEFRQTHKNPKKMLEYLMKCRSAYEYN